MNVGITITGDTVSPALTAAVNTLTFRRAAKVAGQAVRVQIRKHLAEKQLQPNKNNWKKTNWYRRARERVTFVEDAQGTAVSIDFPGFRQRYTGKPELILPVNAKTLAIPIHSMAYGRRPREFKDLLFIPVLRGRTVGLLALQIKVGSTKVFINLYRLVKFVRVKADKTLLPTDADMQTEASRAVIALANTILPQ